MSIFGRISVGALVLCTGAIAWSNEGPEQDLRTTIEQWSVGGQTLRASGKTYVVAPDVQILDRNARFVSALQLKPGVPVLLTLSGNAVTHVIVNPGPSNPFERPGQR